MNRLEEAPTRKRVEIVESNDYVSLRQLGLEDAEELFALIDRNREHLSQFGDETAAKYPDINSMVESIRNPRDPKRLRFAIRNSDGAITGSINLTPNSPMNTQGEIGYYLGKEFEGHGYARTAVNILSTYAFDNLGYKLLYGVVVAENTGSIKVLESCGYKKMQEQNGSVYLSKTVDRITQST